MTTIASSSPPTLRVEDPPLLTGRGTYVANRAPADALVVHFVQSIEASAIITGIDAEEARSMPGVVDVITAADLEAEGVPMLLPARFPDLPAGIERPIMALDRVRFVGEPVAAIVAETEAQAIDAAELVVVDYEPLPPVVDLARAEVDADGALVHPEATTNVVMTSSGALDSVDLSGCEVVVELETVNQRLAPCPLEGRSAAAWWDDDGRLIQQASCQGPHPVRAALAKFHGLAPDRIRVVSADVGGSFGSKAGSYPEELVLGVLARRVGRPVVWTPSRRDDMVGLGHSRAQIHRIRIGGRSDGTIEAIEAEIVGDAGAYVAAAPALVANAGRVLPGPFEVPNVSWTGKVVVTNTTPTVAYRGAGRPEGGAMLNRAIDAFAREIGLDTLTVMRRNVIPAEHMPWANPNGLTYDSGDYPAALELAAAEVDHDGIRARQADERARGAEVRTGIGWTGFIDRTAGLPGNDWGAVELQADGSLHIRTSSTPYGQGHHTAWALVAAQRTGVPVERITVVHGDTDVIPKGGFTGGSRSAQRAGVAVAVATDELIEQARVQAAELLEAAPGDVVLDPEAGVFHVAGAPGAATVDWKALATGWGEAHPSDDGLGLLACEADYDGEGASVPFGFYAAVVTVDTGTGKVVLERLVSVDDAGTVLSPMLVEGQLHGGIGQAVGQALFEEFAYDPDGNPVTGSFLDYAFPSAAEMPFFDVTVVEHPSPNNLLGVKGIAESGTIGAVPAIHNAVIDALADFGVRHIQLPTTPERVWQALREAERAGSPDRD